MTMEQFLLLLDETFENFLDDGAFGCLAHSYGSKKGTFRAISYYRWGIRELSIFVENSVGATYEPQEIYKFEEAVIDFEYMMDVYSKVNPKKKGPFEIARSVAEEVEDILNAMM